MLKLSFETKYFHHTDNIFCKNVLSKYGAKERGRLSLETFAKNGLFLLLQPFFIIFYILKPWQNVVSCPWHWGAPRTNFQRVTGAAALKWLLHESSYINFVFLFYGKQRKWIKTKRLCVKTHIMILFVFVLFCYFSCDYTLAQKAINNTGYCFLHWIVYYLGNKKTLLIISKCNNVSFLLSKLMPIEFWFENLK